MPPKPPEAGGCSGGVSAAPSESPPSFALAEAASGFGFSRSSVRPRGGLTRSQTRGPVSGTGSETPRTWGRDALAHPPATGAPKNRGSFSKGWRSASPSRTQDRRGSARPPGSLGPHDSRLIHPLLRRAPSRGRSLVAASGVGSTRLARPLRPADCLIYWPLPRCLYHGCLQSSSVVFSRLASSGLFWVCRFVGFVGRRGAEPLLIAGPRKGQAHEQRL